MIAFLTAIQFLLLSPAFIRRPFSAQELGRSVGFFPAAGLILGLVLVGADAVIARLLPDLVRSAVLLGLWVILTGALHLDGFLDSCDGLLGGYDPERRLQIMRDERVGAYALAGGILLMLVKFSALHSMDAHLAGLILAPVLGRWAMAVAITSFPYGRAEGLGRMMKDHSGTRQAVLATIFTVLIISGLVFTGTGWISLAAVGASVLTGGLVIRFSLTRLPGLTGDIYGALCEVIETSVLVVMAA